MRATWHLHGHRILFRFTLGSNNKPGHPLHAVHNNAKRTALQREACMQSAESGRARNR